MIDTEPVKLRKWIIVITCFLCIICFNLGWQVGYYNKPAAEKTPDEFTSVNDPQEQTEPSQETVPETTEYIEPTENIQETEPFEPPVTEESPTEPEPTEPEPTEPEYMHKNEHGFSDLEMLAIVIYQEVGGDAACDDCRRRVADIVLNRVASPYFPNTIYGVLTQEGQYGELYWTGIKWSDRASIPFEQYAVKRAWRIAEEVLTGKHSELYGEGYIWQAEFEQGKEGFWCCGHFFGR